jgi:two-component system sensor histidine kinase KdpD
MLLSQAIRRAGRLAVPVVEPGMSAFAAFAKASGYGPFSLDQLDLREVVDRLRGILGDRPVTLDVPESLVPVQVDALLFDQLLTNLVDNVARHAPAPAPLAVRARQPVDGEPWVELVVEDGGPGIPGDAIGGLFERSARLDRRTAGSRRGTGTGLVVVSGFARAMGIDLTTAASRLGGLAVTLRVPAASAPVEPTA